MPIPERPQALQRQSAKSVVYQTVCDWIITGVMKPGEKILDSELASYFNVSRTPVREALQLLQNQKLVCVIPGRTTVVADLDVEDFEKCYRPLAEIDALAAELACRNLTDAMLEELEQELQASAEANIKGDTAAIITHDTRFHELIIDAADNEYIAEISHMLVLHIQRIRYHFFHLPTMRRISASQHRGILDALRERDAQRAKTLMRLTSTSFFGNVSAIQSSTPRELSMQPGRTRWRMMTPRVICSSSITAAPTWRYISRMAAAAVSA